MLRCESLLEFSPEIEWGLTDFIKYLGVINVFILITCSISIKLLSFLICPVIYMWPEYLEF